MLLENVENGLHRLVIHVDMKNGDVICTLARLTDGPLREEPPVELLGELRKNLKAGGTIRAPLFQINYFS